MNPITPEEAEFLAEFTKIDIIPAASLSELDLISETIPAMQPARKISVPLWLAINLRKSTNCQIVPPEWFTADRLAALYEQEILAPDAYQPVPFHYIEIATILLENIPNLPDGEKIRRLVQCIREARFKKTSEGLRSIDGTALQINLLSFMEINEIRPFLLQALNKAAKLSGLEKSEATSKSLSSAAYMKSIDMDGSKIYYDSQMPGGNIYSTDEPINPYSDTYNPYAFSTSQS